MNSWVGRTLSKVRIERPLGRGGMAEVFVGRHTTLDRPVAVKILHAHLQDDLDLRRRFMAEAQAVAALRHPNIVQVFDFDVVDGRPYIVMELLEGLSLAQYLTGLHQTGLTLPLSTICQLIDGIAAALDYAHGRGIVHRDIKPANIMLRQGATPVNPAIPILPDVDPVLTDFGVARLTAAKTQTATGTVLGTPAYMSPEQVRGDEIDGRSDIYSLGIVVYEMLAGQPPFNHDTTPAAVLVKHLQTEPPPVPLANPEVQAVMDKALTKDPLARYARAGDLALELRQASEAAALPAQTLRLPKEGDTGLSRRGRLALLGAGGGLLLIVLLLGGYLAFGNRAAAPAATPTRAPTSGAVQVTEPAQPTAFASPTDEPAATSAPPGPAQSAGAALLRDNSLTLQLQDVEARAGFVYHVWLVNEAGEVLDLGPVSLSDGQLLFSFQAESSLLPQTKQLLISAEPDPDPDPDAAGEILFAGELAANTRAQIALLFDVRGVGPLANSVLNGMQQQAGHFNSHLGFALQSINSGSLSGAKLHSEHVINIVEGRDGELYGDWTNDDRVENPGDDVGLITYLDLLQTMVSASAESDQAEAIVASINGLRQSVSAARDLARRVGSADTVDEVAPLVEEMEAVRLQGEVETLQAQLENLDLVLTLPLVRSGG